MQLDSEAVEGQGQVTLTFVPSSGCCTAMRSRLLWAFARGPRLNFVVPH